tara:strand:+ start:162 stop:1268 length:1107 start_codon:yes stop_codon:yes gene_type:complete
MYIPFLPLNKKQSSKKNQVDESRLKYFKLGRHAMCAGIDHTKLDKNKCILMPSSICMAAIEPFIEKGIKISHYSIDKNMNWDIKEIESKISDDISAVYIVHYFGIRSDTRELANICQKKNKILIEDFALSGFNIKLSETIFSDIAIFSLWKFHPIADGAMLYLNKPKPLSINLLDDHAFNIWKLRLKILIKKYFVRYSVLSNVLNKLKKKTNDLDSKSNSFESLNLKIRSISKHSKKIFLNEDLDRIHSIRMNNFKSYISFFKENRINCLYEKIDSHSFPYCFPIIFEKVNDLKQMLQHDGIETEISVNPPFDDIRYVVFDNCNKKEVLELSQNVLSLPLHQDLSIKEIQYIQNCVVKNIEIIRNDYN